MAIVPTGPLTDERSPAFAKGQWFGGVPHTRIVIQQPGDWSLIFSAINRGILLQMSNSDFSDPNIGFAEWRGTYVVIPNVLNAVCVYRWSVASEVAGTANFLYHQTFSAGIPELYGAIQQTRPDLPANKVLPLSIRIPDNSFTPTVVTKFDVPEWADVLERWPTVQVTDSF